MKKIYLIRHGQSESNAGGAAQINHGIALTEIGHKQAQQVADWVLDNIGAEYITSIGVSKFLRTQQTAAPLVAATSIEPTEIEGLHEFDYLSFDKIAGTSLSSRVKMADAYWQDYDLRVAHGDDAESFHSFYERVATVLNHFKTLESGNHIVYTHGLWISMLIWQILGQPASLQKHMRKFRQFEMSIRAKNCEVFCLTLAPNLSSDTLNVPSLRAANPSAPDTTTNTATHCALLDHIPPAITKVRSRSDVEKPPIY